MARRQQLAESLVSRAGQRRASAHRPLQVGLLLVRSDTNDRRIPPNALHVGWQGSRFLRFISLTWARYSTLIESLEATTAIGTPRHSISTGSEESARNGILRFN